MRRFFHRRRLSIRALIVDGHKLFAEAVRPALERLGMEARIKPIRIKRDKVSPNVVRLSGLLLVLGAGVGFWFSLRTQSWAAIVFGMLVVIGVAMMLHLSGREFLVMAMKRKRNPPS